MASETDLGIDQLSDAEVIGRGGFSTVYAATDTQFDRRVAVKVLRKLSEDSDRNRFERECKVMGRLSSHANVVTLYNAGYTNDDEPYMIMELNEEGSLADLLESEGPQRWTRALEVMIPVLRALHHAHEAGVLHRDVKPENVLIADGVPRLTDFGIAYLRDSTGATSTSITASWLHTAPETFDNKRDERADVYSAASTLYCLIAGRAPFENPEDESLNPLMRRLLDEAPPALPPGTGPAALSAYLNRALAKNPDERPATAAEMADGLQVILDSGGLKMPLDNTDGASQATAAPLGTPDPGPGRPSQPHAESGGTTAGDTRSMPHRPPPISSGPTSHRSGPTPAQQPVAGGSYPPPYGSATPAYQLAPAAFAPPTAPPSAPPNAPPPNAPPPNAPPPNAAPPHYGQVPPAGAPDPNQRLGTPPIQPAYGQQPAAYQAPVGHAPSGYDPANAASPTPRSGGPGRTILVILAVAGAVSIIAAVAGVALLRTGDAGVEVSRVGADDGEVAEEPADEAEETSDRASSTTTIDALESGFDPADRPDVALPTFDGEAETIAELEDRWAANRAAVVTALSADGYGIDESNVLHGPGNFAVDLNDCPAEWSETSGIDDTTIRVGQTIATSGNLASYANLSSGMEAYFDVVNQQGGIDGRQIELTVRDDAYDPSRTIDEVETFVTDDEMFAVTTLGSPNTLATYDRLNGACVPQPFVASSHPAFADPVNYPFTTPLAMTWGTEAVLWGTWIEQNMADQLPVRVSALVMDNDFGLAYSGPFQAWADDHPEVIAEFTAVAHDPTAVGLDAEMATVAATNADVFIAMTSGEACGLAALGGETAGLGAEVKFMPSVCRDPAFLQIAGQGADGYLNVSGGVKATTDAALADDPYIAFVNSELQAAGYDSGVSLYGSGFAMFGWTWVETLRIAAELPGGLTRSNFLLAARGMQLVHPLTIDNVPFSVAGTDDAHYIESSDVTTFDAAQQQWIAGPVVSAEGETPNCPWVSGGCRS